MYYKPFKNKTTSIFLNTTLISPVLKKNSQIQIYLYKFNKSRLELTITTGVVESIKGRNTNFNTSTIVLKQKIYGITVYTKYQLNNISLIGIRLINNNYK